MTEHMEPGQPLPETDEEATRYIPEHAHGLYSLYRDMGQSVVEAMTHALEACVKAYGYEIAQEGQNT